MKSKPLFYHERRVVNPPDQPSSPDSNIVKPDWRAGYQEQTGTKPFKLEDTADDSTLNRMIQLRKFDNTDIIEGKPGALYYDQVNQKVKVYLANIGWVNLITSNDTIGLTSVAGIELPHLMQSDSTTQAISNTSNAQVITFNTDIHHKHITRTSSSRFTFSYSGSYLITFSGIADLATSTAKHLEAWIRVNGNDVSDSNTRVELVGNAEVTVAFSYLNHFNAGDYIEFWTWGDSTSCRWLATTAGSTPTRPAVPSIIITCNFISTD